MKSTEKSPRPTVAFVPYRVGADGSTELFLQLSDDTHPTLHRRGKYGTFGGAVEEGESCLDAVIREATEELEVIDLNGRPLVFERDIFVTLLDEKGEAYGFMVQSVKGMDIVWVYHSSVGNLFVVGEDKSATNVRVREGAGGRFFSEQELRSSPLINESFREPLLKVFTEIQKSINS